MIAVIPVKMEKSFFLIRSTLLIFEQDRVYTSRKILANTPMIARIYDSLTFI
jgi:hypothetical protein